MVGRVQRQAEAEVDGKDDIYMLHDIIDNIERQINEEMGILCTIHLDPVVTDDEEVNRLKQIAIDALLTVCSEASIHDFRIVMGERCINLIFDVVVPYSVDTELSVIEKRIQEGASSIDSRYNCVIQFDRDYN